MLAADGTPAGGAPVALMREPSIGEIYQVVVEDGAGQLVWTFDSTRTDVTFDPPSWRTPPAAWPSPR